MTRKNLQKTDVIIIGCGLIGLTAAIACRRIGLSVALVDKSAMDIQILPDFDGRASAIAADSFNMLQTLGVTAHLSGQMQSITDILISDGAAGQAPSGLDLHFSASDMAQRGVSKPMGYMIENRHLRAALLAELKTADVIWHAPATVSDSGAYDDKGWVELNSGERLTAKLVIAADGRGSAMRVRAGVKVTGWDYPQMGIVTTVAHELPHKGVAHELFLPAGPLALLPLPDDKNGVHRSSIVWSEQTRAAKAAMALPDDLFEAELIRRMGGVYGAANVCAPRAAYPLGLQMAERCYAPRLALIGDAAHAIHPIAGQGLNLGLRDIAALAQVLEDTQSAGADIGAEGVLQNYTRWRKADNLAMGLSTDVLNRLFSNNIGPLKHARRLGIGAIDRLKPARSFFMRQAAGQANSYGLSRTIPRLLQD